MVEHQYPGFIAGAGAAVGDVDGDGRADVYLAGGGLYLNRPDARGFLLAASSAIPAPDLTPIGVALGDFDRDGDLDLALCGHGGARLFVNDGNGSFHDGTAAAGVAGSADDLSMSVAWGDLDGDGYLDLIVANYGIPRDGNLDAQQSRLYLNRRDGTFAALPPPLGQSTLTVRALFATFADFDGDGLLDLHVADDAEIPFLDATRPRHDLVLLNRGLDASGQLALVESSAPLGLDNPRATMGCAVGDSARGPGWELLFADLQAEWLYHGPGAGAPFSDVTQASAIDLAGPPKESWVNWGGAFADLDGDGFEDALVGQAPLHPGQPGTDTLGPLLLRNRGGSFALTRYAFGGPMRAHAILLADLDGDGDDDAIVAPFADRFRFFVNQTAPRRYVRVELDATVSAPGAAGAVVMVKSGGVTQKRMRVAGGQPHSSGEEILDFALAGASVADVTITWPSGAVQTVPGVAAPASVKISEPRWITLSNARPAADGATQVVATVDVAGAGLGAAGSKVRWTAAGASLDAVADGTGVATFDLPPRTSPGALQATITVDGRVLPAHPALDYH